VLGDTKRVRLLVFEGLRINIPPKREQDQKKLQKDSAGAANSPRLAIEKVVADGTILKIIPKQPGKEPLRWDIKELTLERIGHDAPMKFETVLVNAKPPGDIHSTGRFGPWNGDDPGQSFVDGKYTFENADLGVFKGIAGTLSSTGSYRGVLGRIEADGTTDTPNFRLDAVDNPVPLTTTFHAIIDGTSGDTLLQPVNAQLGRSVIICRGGVIGTPGVKGKTVALDVTIHPAHIEDILRLTVRSKRPVMTGGMRSTAKMEIPPGDRDVIEKLRLYGKFGMGGVQFTSAPIQEKIEEMSQRAKGEPAEDPGRVASDFGGAFTLRNGMIKLDGLTFTVPGANVNLDGSYGIRSEEIDFRGTLRMEARVSETMTGVKSFLLKAVDPFFAKDGAGAVIPIKITGTREEPQFGLNLRGGKKKQQKK
jgi:AsmA-like C-terminal region